MNLEQIKEIQERLRTQDGWSTAHPIYEVREKKRIYGMSDEFVSDFVWVNVDGDREDVKERP